MSLHIDEKFFKRFITALGDFFQGKCEIVIHDYCGGFDHTIVDIVNGELSGRKVGDAPRGAFIIAAGKQLDELPQKTPIYSFNTSQGKTFRSCTVFITDDSGKIEGSVCVNCDVTDLISVQSLIQNMISVPNLSTDTTDSESQLVRNVDEFLQYYLSQCEQIFKQPLYSLSKEEKIKALQFLDEKGVFKISKANILLCEAFKFSKFTLYNYLEEARKKKITID